MPTKLFFELHESKQQQIVNVGIAEFATYGYINSSTNRIVKNSGISKGSLFKYFTTKEELYFFILDTVTTEFIKSLNAKSNNLSTELFQRLLEYSTLEFTWYIHNPEKAKLIIKAFETNDTDIYQKTIERYSIQELDIFNGLLENIDLSNIPWDKDKITNILKWFLKGFKADFLTNTQLENYSYDYLCNEYLRSLTEYINVIKTGLIKK